MSKYGIILETLSAIADYREHLEDGVGNPLTRNVADAIRHIEYAESCLYNELSSCYPDRHSGTQEDSSSEQCGDSL